MKTMTCDQSRSEAFSEDELLRLEFAVAHRADELWRRDGRPRTGQRPGFLAQGGAERCLSASALAFGRPNRSDFFPPGSRGIGRRGAPDTTRPRNRRGEQAGLQRGRVGVGPRPTRCVPP